MIYPISITDYDGESPAVVTIADDEKIKAIMKGLDDIKNNYFYEALYNSAIKNNCDIACGNIIRGNNKKKRKALF